MISVDTCETINEAMIQLVFQLVIIMSSDPSKPTSKLQIMVVTWSLIMASKGPAEEFLSKRMKRRMKEKDGVSKGNTTEEADRDCPTETREDVEGIGKAEKVTEEKSQEKARNCLSSILNKYSNKREEGSERIGGRSTDSPMIKEEENGKEIKLQYYHEMPLSQKLRILGETTKLFENLMLGSCLNFLS